LIILIKFCCAHGALAISIVYVVAAAIMLAIMLAVLIFLANASMPQHPR
jgi:hypothetical protein